MEATFNQPSARGRWMGALALGSLLMACPKPRPTVPVAERMTDVAALLAVAERRESAVTALKGDAKLKASMRLAQGSSGLFVAAQWPDQVHLEALDFFGRPAAMWISNAARFEFVDAQEDKTYRGAATRRAMEDFLQLPVEPMDLAPALLGRGPSAAGLRASSVLGFDEDQNCYRVEWLGPAGVERTQWLDAWALRTTAWEWNADPQHYRLSFSDFEPLHDAARTPFPRSLELSWKNGERLQLKYQELDVLVPPEAELFQIAD